MPTASGRMMTSCGPGGPGSGTSSTTITPGDLVTAASIRAGPSLPQAPLRALVRGGAPGLGGESHPSADRAMTSPPNRATAFWVRPQSRPARPGGRHKPGRKLDNIISGRHTEGSVLLERATVRLPALPGREPNCVVGPRGGSGHLRQHLGAEQADVIGVGAVVDVEV